MTLGKPPHRASVSSSVPWAWQYERLPCTGTFVGQAQGECPTCHISSNPHSNPVKQLLLISPVYRWGN